MRAPGDRRPALGARVFTDNRTGKLVAGRRSKHRTIAGHVDRVTDDGRVDVRLLATREGSTVLIMKGVAL